MSGASRLLSIRLQGFKSFAERTHVELGPGISAVVGPNGSGKSNLADALRWALGEQGRALRSRKAEDVIWAGSERRPALGMADVQLIVDNADGLLPVDYGVVELGRRLYRSGENDYLLNRQRVRLRDLVELLDGAHLADNAFLFIGQGMVDQALALRPEERRPLFEEVAGVRRHERRRRRAEEQLAESEANLARVDDILGELRPQARRLSAQAEQQASRRSAGDELAAAILSAAHARWHGAARRVEAGSGSIRAARELLDTALDALEGQDARVAGLTAELAGRASAEAERRAELETARGRLTELKIATGRIASEITATERDRRRIRDERPALEAELARAGDVLASPPPSRDLALEAELARADADLANALSGSRDGTAADAEADAADAAVVRRLEAARRADAEVARRRLAEAERTVVAETARAQAAIHARDAAEAARTDAGGATAAATAALESARRSRADAERELAGAEVGSGTAAAALGAARAAASGIQARLEAAESTLAEAARDAFATAALARGGRRLEVDVVVEPDHRLAVRAALAGLGRAVVVPRSEIRGLARERGVAISEEAIADQPAGERVLDPAVATFLAAVSARGGGRLRDAIRSDPRGTTTRLLARVAWLPDLDACVALQAGLPAGWVLVSQDGRAVVGDATVQLGMADPAIDARAEIERLRTQRRDADAAVASAAEEVARLAAVLADRRAALETARTGEAAAAGGLRRAEDHERAVIGAAEAATREAAWLEAQAARLEAESDRLRAASIAFDDVGGEGGSVANDAPGGRPESRIDGTSADAARDTRVAALRAARERLARLLADADARRVSVERQRAAAEAGIALGRSRLAALDMAALDIGERDARLEHERGVVERELAAVAAAEGEARSRVEALVSQDAADRQRLAEAEREAGRGREGVAIAQAHEAAMERESLEARLALEAVREQVMVELAGLGSVGLGQLRAVAGGHADGPTTAPDDASIGVDDALAAPDDALDADDERLLAAAVEVAAPIWAATEPPVPPSPARLASLRRRFHELGAGNPFAVEEYAEAKARLEALETQRADLEAAIERTRTLIAELDSLIATQFRTTFEALERAFEARFQQLFGGGYAKLSLTDPADLTATGVEIVARPPGKKPQPLAMLSGGERALTAVALLFAMLEVRPVPFCVLDEVDAALDEANIGRFTDALRELSTRTQCIVITHNRGTIEVADALYGVTVGEDSVSRVISLRLEEATGIADRAAAAVGVGSAPAETLEPSRAGG